MKFSIKNCLNRLKQFIKEINCCNSKCMNNTIEILNQENLNKIDALQERWRNWSPLYKIFIRHIVSPIFN